MTTDDELFDAKKAATRERLVEASRELLALFLRCREEPATSCDFEDAFIGGVDIDGMLRGNLRWFRTPFAEALKRMVEDGEVLAVKDEERGWLYTLVKK